MSAVHEPNPLRWCTSARHSSSNLVTLAAEKAAATISTLRPALARTSGEAPPPDTQQRPLVGPAAQGSQ
eukprot:CAMPEP_0115354754 /NCGR_PEP_ID=MMETSP0270-20121206/98754_1 /TAXON_ID=71861 /ORGANISM="Scrippsiella trochoidea, Strain CCMP3099" /LENGTH=68 /DNA_ID=CAMNT_0002777107 /DNA_START=121 /DNA_END=325 /DNA_ORIENTATION=+